MFAVFGELTSSVSNEKGKTIAICKDIFKQIQPEAGLLGWKEKTSSERRISVIIYDVLTDAGYPQDKIEKLVPTIVALAKRLF